MKEMKSLDNKIALITGAGTGMGRSHALMLGSEGAHVYVTDISEQLGLETVALVHDAGGSATALLHDVSSESQWLDVLNTIDNIHGRLDILVNNAGIATWDYLENISNEFWDRIFSINANSAFLGCRHGLALMKKAGGGAIVNIASSLTHHAVPMVAHYIASKGAVMMLTKAAAFEYAKYGIRVNSVHPGIIETPMTTEALKDPCFVETVISKVPINRAGQPDEVSSVVLFLVSDKASFVTGADVLVDAGAFAAHM